MCLGAFEDVLTKLREQGLSLDTEGLRALGVDACRFATEPDWSQDHTRHFMAHDLYIKSHKALGIPGSFERKPKRFHLINLGFFKCGTSSVAGWFENYLATQEFMIDDLANFLEGFPGGPPPIESLRAWVRYRDAIAYLEVDTSGVNGYLYDAFATEFPEAKFLLPIRDPYSWAGSIINEFLSPSGLAWYSNPREENWYSDSIGTVDSHLNLMQASLWHSRKSFEANLVDIVRGYGDFWQRMTTYLLKNTQRERTFYTRLGELNKNSAAIAKFVGISESNLCNLGSMSVEVRNSASDRPPGFDMRKQDRAFLESVFSNETQELTSRLFDGYTLDDFVAGESARGSTPVEEISI
jgi:hypothetical protein